MKHLNLENGGRKEKTEQKKRNRKKDDAQHNMSNSEAHDKKKKEKTEGMPVDVIPSTVINRDGTYDSIIKFRSRCGKEEKVQFSLTLHDKKKIFHQVEITVSGNGPIFEMDGRKYPGEYFFFPAPLSEDWKITIAEIKKSLIITTVVDEE